MRITILLSLFIIVVNVSILVGQDFTEPEELLPKTGDPYSDDLFIYPVGWSEQSELAYFIWKYGDAANITDIYLIVQNMITDKIKFYGRPVNSEEEGYGKTPFNQYWNENRIYFTEILNKHGIKQQKSTLNDFPIFLNNSNIQDELDIILETHELEAEKSPYEFAYLDSLQVIANSKEYGTKVIHRESDKYIALSVSVMGYLKSPFEERIAVFVSKKHYGFEGVLYTNYLIIGCAQDSGFE